MPLRGPLLISAGALLVSNLVKISTSFTQTSVVRITGNADEAWVHESPPRRGSFCLHPELSEKPGESCMPSGSQRGAGGGTVGGS